MAKNAEIPANAVRIRSYEFFENKDLQTVRMPDSVKVIEYAAFSGCTGLKSIRLPPGVTEIDDGAFFGCTGLTSIVIPNSAAVIGQSAFSGCSSLKDIQASPQQKKTILSQLQA